MEGYHRLLLAVFATTGVACLPVAWLLWKASARARGRRLRSTLRVASAPLLLALFVSLLTPVGAAPARSGRWACMVCRRVDERHEYAGVALWNGRADPTAPGVPEALAWEWWFWSEIGLAHEHRWAPVGCQGLALTTTMCFGTLERHPFYGLLVALPAGPMRDGILRTWSCASDREQQDALWAAWSGEGGGWKRFESAVREHAPLPEVEAHLLALLEAGPR